VIIIVDSTIIIAIDKDSMITSIFQQLLSESVILHY